MSAAAAAAFEDRSDPGATASAVLAGAVHVLLLLVLIFGVSWQNRPPESVQVELWEPPAPAPAPAVQEAPKPAPVVEPPPAPKPEPAIPKADIVEKKAPPPPPKPAPKAEPKPPPKKPEAKPVPKSEPLKPRMEDVRRMQEQLAREQNTLALERETQQLREQAARDSAAARAKGLADWQDKVRTKVRNNVVLPPAITGNPEAVFEVSQLPNGEVLNVRLKKSSGVAALDDAIERAIRKSSPLPKPDTGESAPRAFDLKYRPVD